MPGNLLSVKTEQLMMKVTEWGTKIPGLLGIVLVGSYARGDARSDSDIDLVVILEDTSTLMVDVGWAGHFGPVVAQSWENWGKVQSLRVHYNTGMEVEFGVTGRHWLANPIDEGTRDVLLQGVMIIYDPHQFISRQFKENGIQWRYLRGCDA